VADPIKTNRLTPEYVFDLRLGATGRYRGSNGRIIRNTVVLEVLERAITANRRSMRNLSRQLVGGELTLAEWQMGMAKGLKDIHLASAALAKGGWGNLSQSDMGYIGSQVKAQLRFLGNFALQIADGTQPLLRADGQINGQFLVRTDLYAQSGITTYHNIRRREARNRNWNREQRILDPTVKKHCNCCIAQANRGPSPIGSLLPIGACDCATNDRCVYIFLQVDSDGKILARSQ